jgi:hypothetical protein
MTWSERLGRVGVWRGVNDLDPAMAKTIEELVYGTIWQGGSPGSDLRAAEELLNATESLQLATGISGSASLELCFERRMASGTAAAATRSTPTAMG